MDPLDIKATSPAHDPWGEFLGIGNNKQKLSAQNQYEQDLLTRFPFSLDCEEQKALVKAMYAESAATLSERNSAKKNSSHRNDLTGKLRAFDAYIPQAVEFMNTVACSVPSGTGGNSTSGTAVGVDNVLNTTIPPGTAAAGAAGGPGQTATAQTTGTTPAAITNTLAAATDKNATIKKYAILGGVGLLILGIGIYIAKRKQ